MPRRRRAEVREVAPDPIFGSTLVEKFVNSLMWEGRKAVAQRVFYAAMTKVGVFLPSTIHRQQELFDGSCFFAFTAAGRDRAPC